MIFIEQWEFPAERDFTKFLPICESCKWKGPFSMLSQQALAACMNHERYCARGGRPGADGFEVREHGTFTLMYTYRTAI